MWTKLKHIFSKLQDEESRFIFMKRLQFSLDNQDMETLYEMAISKEDCGEHSLYTLLKKRKCFSKDQPIVLYGAGFRGKIDKPFIEGYKVGKLIGFCDDNNELQGTICEGLPVLSVEEACKQEAKVLFVITSEKYSKEMKKNLLALGIEEERIYSYTSKKQIYGTQYFDRKIIRPHSYGEVFIDGGCYDSRDIYRFIDVYPDFKKIYAFEPDVLNYKKCIETKRQCLKDDDRVEIVNKGLWSKNEKLSFWGGAESTSHLAEYGDVNVDVTSLDIFLQEKEEKITFIKMDIEGAELEALKGAKETIIKYKPDLAICIYHKNEDIIEIPEYILELDSDYELYIRHYDLTSYETVLYAVRPRYTPHELSDIKWKILTKVLEDSEKIIETLSDLQNPVIYGKGNLAYALVKEMKARGITPLCIIDNYKESGDFEGIPVYNIKEAKDLESKEISIIVTPVQGFPEIYKNLSNHYIQGNIIPIWDIINDSKIAERLKYINRI